ncbi:MAG: hypothetical protein PHC51_04870 [bacterium]|nr:hypothetical protein [bacterium]
MKQSLSDLIPCFELPWHVPRNVIYLPSGPVYKVFERELRRSSRITGQKLVAGTIQCLIAENALLVGPAIGEPAAALALAPLLHSGGENVFLCGTCGYISPQPSTDAEIKPLADIGSIIYPTTALGGKTAQVLNFIPGVPWIKSSHQEALESHLRNNAPDLQSLNGSVWTTDIPPLVSSKEFLSYRDEGAVAVEMELATVYQLCQLSNKPLAAVFAVSDSLGAVHRRGFAADALKSTLQQLAHELLSLAQAA